MTFDAQPVLPGASIRLRPLQSNDFDALYAVARDPLIWEQHPEPERYRVDVFREFFDQAIDSRGALVVQTREGEVIGSSRFYGFDPEHSEVEIGWTFLARSHWGGGTNGELKALMLGHAFRFVERVVFRAGAENLRSQRALEKIGAVLVGERLDGGRRNLVFEIRRARWMKRGAASG